MVRPLFKLVVLSLLASCAPTQSIDLAVVDAGDESAAMGGNREGGQGGQAGQAGQGGRSGEVDAGDFDRQPSPDRAGPDEASPQGDAGLPLDLSGEPAGPPPPFALLVVADMMVPVPGDLKLKERLEAQGLSVKLGDDDRPVTDADGAALVLLSSSCVSATLVNHYRDIALPIIVLESASFDDMGMIAAAERTVDFDEEEGNSVTIVKADHPLAAGLTGAVTVTSATVEITWGKPLPTADLVATHMGAAGKYSIFAYAKGSMMAGLTAPAKRVGLFATFQGAEAITPDGTKLIDAAIAWAVK
jgi:hypothetical protein